MEIVRQLFESRASAAASSDPRARGQVRDYDAPPITGVGWRMFQSKEDFERVDSDFKTQKDRFGNSMHDVAKKYWDDPEFREKQNQEIEEMRRKRGRS